MQFALVLRCIARLAASRESRLGRRVSECVVASRVWGWGVGVAICVAQVGTKRCKSAQIGANRHTSAQVAANRCTSAQIGTNRRKSAHIGANRRKSGQIGTNRRNPAGRKSAQIGATRPGANRCQPAGPYRCKSVQAGLAVSAHISANRHSPAQTLGPGRAEPRSRTQ